MFCCQELKESRRSPTSKSFPHPKTGLPGERFSVILIAHLHDRTNRT